MSRSTLTRHSSLILLALALAFPAAGRAAEPRPPTTPDALIATVTEALARHDAPAFEALVNWTGAGPHRRRLVMHQVSAGFGRKVRSIALEPFPADGLAEAESRGTLKANMRVTHQLRIVFDEPGEDGAPPTSLFLVGQEGETFRIALVLPVGRKGD